MENAMLKRALLAGLNAGIAEFWQNPYRFLSEFDIQKAMFQYLRQLARGSVTVGRGERPGDPYVLDLIYSEYWSGNTQKYGEKIDIVCLDSEKICKQGASSDPNYIYHLPLFCGIELKYAQMDHKAGFQPALDDMARLRAIDGIKYRLVLQFLQDDRVTRDLMADGCVPKTRIERPALLLLEGMYLVTPDKIIELQQ